MRVSSTDPHPSRISFRLLLKLAQWTRNSQPEHHSEQGLSLIECLVAIIIITLTVVAITPPIMLANATRVQARKAAQAGQIAQGEIDRIRTLVERRERKVNLLPADIGDNDISKAPVPTGTGITAAPLLSPASCSTYPLATPVERDKLVRVDINGDCTPEYAMQVFRTTGYSPLGETDVTSGKAIPYAFIMGVRVYAYNPNVPFPTTLDTKQASLVQGTGPRDLISGGARRPLAVLYSPMARNDSSGSLGQLCVQAAKSAAARCIF